MKDLKVSSESTKTNRKIKKEIEKQLEESIVNGERHGNTEIEERGRTVKKPEDAATIISEFEETIRSKKKNTVWLAYQQCTIF